MQFQILEEEKNCEILRVLLILRFAILMVKILINL